MSASTTAARPSNTLLLDWMQADEQQGDGLVGDVSQQYSQDIDEGEGSSCAVPVKKKVKKAGKGTKNKGKKRRESSSAVRPAWSEQSNMSTEEAQVPAIEPDEASQVQPVREDRLTPDSLSLIIEQPPIHDINIQAESEDTPLTPPVDPEPKEHEQQTMPVNAPWEDVFQHALNASILSGRFEDIRFIAYSRRARAQGHVDEARVLHANSMLVKRALPEARIGAYPRMATRDGPYDEFVNDYPYSDDSDLEDGPEVDNFRDALHAVPAQVEAPIAHTQPETQGPATDSPGRPVSVTHHAGRGESPSEDFVSIHPSDGEGPPGTGHNAYSGVGLSGNGNPQVVEGSATLLGSQQSSAQRTIVMTDGASKTWRALVFYAYTHDITFAPLRSQRLTSTPADGANDASRLPTCSPKSIYRLAEKYGNKELRQLAKDDIASKISANNVLDELFSRFVARHPEIQEMQLDILMKHLKDPDVTSRLPAWVDRFASGELRECASTFALLIGKLTSAATAVAIPSGGAEEEDGWRVA
ncbi:hypothetical protein BV20DRAFT_1124801 [Pilatotrama ljubarskyi]|nr:hypothetical protein BV20DRAFT_1124801 [Pilatotrama ljubarskyi]